MSDAPSETELSFFDPEQIQTLCDRNLASGLRAIADALDAKQVDGKLLRAMGVGSNDDKCHVLVRVDISAPFFRRQNHHTDRPQLRPSTVTAGLRSLIAESSHE